MSKPNEEYTLIFEEERLRPEKLSQIKSELKFFLKD